MKNRPWQQILLLVAGIFMGSYWIMDGYFLAMQLWSAGTGWQSIFPVFPGMAILALVLLARRAPVPYGTGLVLLGLMALIFFSRRGPMMRTLLLGPPLCLLGFGFIRWWPRTHSSEL